MAGRTIEYAVEQHEVEEDMQENTIGLEGFAVSKTFWSIFGKIKMLITGCESYFGCKAAKCKEQVGVLWPLSSLFHSILWTLNGKSSLTICKCCFVTKLSVL